MSLFDQIQSSVLQEHTSLNAVLLKLTLLASCLDSEPMAQWVRAELKGYTSDAVPEYRVVAVEYCGTFRGRFETIENMSIPLKLIEKIAGNEWTQHKMTQGISEVEQLAARSAQSDARIRLPCSNLILKLAGIYDNHICTEVVGLVSPTSMVNILANVRSKVLDLTIAMEKAYPDVRKLSVGNYPMPSDAMTMEMNHAFYQTVHGGDVINNIFYLPELERIVIERINASGGTDAEKKRLLEQVKTVGVQEVVKQVIQKVPGLVGLLSNLPS